jgi:hypothetical protein
LIVRNTAEALEHLQQNCTRIAHWSTANDASINVLGLCPQEHNCLQLSIATVCKSKQTPQPVSPAAMLSRGACTYAYMHNGATRQQKLGNNAALHPPLARKSETPLHTVNDWQPSPFDNMVTCAMPSRRLVRKVRGKS